MPEISYYKRCQCKVPAVDEAGEPLVKDNGSPRMKDIGLTCAKLKDKGHGTWYFYFEGEPGKFNARGRVRRGGFARKDDAKAEAKKLLGAADAGTDVLSKVTVGEDLQTWIKRKKALARTTTHGYEEHIKLYLMPHLGHIKRRDLSLRHIETMFNAIEKENAERLIHHARVTELQEARVAAHQAWVRAAGKKEERRRTRRAFLDANAALREGRRGRRKITSATTMHRINATLSTFLTSGIKREEYTKNYAQLIELPPATKHKPLVWTPERVEQWKKTGEKPGPVMVWTPEQTGAFLDFVKTDRLYAMWHTFVFLGPRRGELCALPWTEVSITDLRLRISAQIVEVAYRLYGEAPKQDSVRSMSMTEESGRLLSAWRSAQTAEHELWNGATAWVESDRVFTQENGEPYHPDWISRRFKRLVELSGLPPVRLHDLRHTSASLALLAKNDIKVVQERLGHSSRQITSDTYTSVMPELMRTEAESTLAVVPRAEDLAYEALTPLGIPVRAFHSDLAVVYAHGTEQGDLWTVKAKLTPRGQSLGEIQTRGRSQDQAADVAAKWIRDHCSNAELKILDTEILNSQLPEEQKTRVALVRFVIERSSPKRLSHWGQSEPRSRRDDGAADTGPTDSEAAA
ncbi:tyrosine-type recombinase/integrase [Streptomyces sp. NPDC059070]|uniref:tyrosine-type recombinase/integrase n=1 Tax=Streptomyces sp. NPDC059070 TaxID=3346713 RepID=UPI0036AD39B3